MNKFLSLLLLLPSLALGSVLDLERFLAQGKAYQANFVQRTVDEAGEVTAISSGTMALRRDQNLGQFRWHYQEPWQQIIVGDGQTLWQYDADLEQATKRPMQESLAGTPAELLVGGMQLAEWDVTEENVWVVMRPHNNDMPFQSIALRFEAQNLAGMKLLDQFDQTTHVVFDHINTAPEFNRDSFVFVPPAGTEIIGADNP